MIVSINQPAYLPWLGYFHRIAVSDVHIVLDHVQFEKNSFTNRNRIRTKDGGTWLTVPVRTKGRFENVAINELEVVQGDPWRKKHLKSIALNYSRTDHFAEHGEFLAGFYAKDWRSLGDLAREMTGYLLEQLGIGTKILFSSEMDVTGRKDELVFNLCKAVDAETYVSGPLGRDYLKEERFTADGMRVVYQDYEHPEYAQAFAGFEPYMAIIDLMFNCGSESLNILMKDQGRIE